MTAAELVARLEGRRSGSGWVARCPAHEDRRASLSISEGDDGRVLVKCHAGCSLSAILGRLCLEERDLFPPREGGSQPRGRIVASYDYTDEAGTLLYQVVRFDPKDFRQRRPDATAGWSWSLGGVRRVLFRLPGVVKAASAGGAVFVVEGEKDVLALERLGLTATTNPGGAGKWRSEYVQALRGCKGVVVLLDNDETGRKHAAQVAASVHQADIAVKVLELPGLPPKGDVSDWLAAGGSKKQLLDLVKAAPRWESPAHPPCEVADLSDSAVLVRVSTVQTKRVEWEWMHRMPRGKVTVLDGDPGLGKSTLVLDLIAHRTRGLSLPGDDRHLEPAGAVILTAEDGLADTIKPRLVEAGGDLDRVAVLTAVRDAKGRTQLPAIPDHVEAVREAVRRMQARFLVVDPLMAFLNSKFDSHRDQDVRGVLAQLAELADREDLVVILVRHLNKTSGGHPIYRGGGSIGIIGAARAGLLVAPDPKDNTRRVLAVSKSNLGPIPPSLAYRLVAAGESSRVEWEGVSECSAGDLLAAQREDLDGAGPREEAEGFLRELLAPGPVAAKSVRKQAREAGVQDRTLDRAKAALGVRSTKAGGRYGGDPTWYWELPPLAEHRHDPVKDANIANPGDWRSSGSGGDLQAPADPDEEVVP